LASAYCRLFPALTQSRLTPVLPAGLLRASRTFASGGIPQRQAEKIGKLDSCPPGKNRHGCAEMPAIAAGILKILPLLSAGADQAFQQC